MRISTIIIDDQPDATEDLLYLIRKGDLPLEVVSVVHSGPEGLAAIMKHKPQLVFLDVVMPGMSGFELLELVPKLDFQLIITTSNDQYAIQALRASAIDFLLKPVKMSELNDAIGKVTDRVGKQALSRQQLKLLEDNLKHREPLMRKIALGTSDGVELVVLKDILYFESDGNYTSVHLSDGKNMLVTRQLGKFEELVGNAGFFRVHNSFLVNLDRITKFVRSDGGYIVLENGKTISVARQRKDDFIKLIGGL